MPKKKAGRPTKLTSKFIQIAEEVLFEGHNAVILTDEDLLFVINSNLPEKERVAYSTLQEWKAGITKKSQELEFRNLYKKALIKQKLSLFARLSEDDKAWTRWAWIIERKFDDWNIKQKVDHTTKGKELPTPILGGASNVRSDNSNPQDS